MAKISKILKNAIPSLLSVSFIINLSAGTISNYSTNVFIFKSLASIVLLSLVFADIRINKVNLKEKFKDNHPKKIILVILPFLLYLAATLSYSADFSYGLQKIINFITSSIPSIIGFYYIILTIGDRNPSLYMSPLVTISAISVVIILVEYPFNQSQFYHYEPGRWSHVIYGRMMGFIGLVSLLYILTLKDLKQIIFIGVSAGLSAYGLYLSALRSGMIAFLIVFLVLIVIVFFKVIRDKSNRLLNKNRFIGIISSLILTTLMIVFIPSPSIIDSRIYNLTQIEALEFGNDEPIQSRLELLKISEQLFLENPVFGIGFGGFKSFNELTEVLKYPHNIFIEMAVETGVLGLLILCVLLFMMIKAANRFSPYSLLLIAYSLLLASFSKDLPSQSYLWIFIAFTAFTETKRK